MLYYYMFLVLAISAILLTAESMKLETPINPSWKSDQRECSRFCLLGQECWPSEESVLRFGENLQGEVLFPIDPNYSQYASQLNGNFQRYPGVVVVPLSAHDVQLALTFAKEHNMLVSIKSSGHDYLGKSTADGSMMINMKNMTSMEFNFTDLRSPSGESVTVGGGSAWLPIYIAANKYGRVVCGGSSYSVSVGGYLPGGGHSGLSRSLGLGVDSLIAFSMVLSDGTLAECSDRGTLYHGLDGSVRWSDNRDLFWAVRGGGGGTFGVVTSYTLQLHPLPSEINVLKMRYPMSYQGQELAYDVLQKVFQLYHNLPSEWGGYITPISYSNPALEFKGYLDFSLIHYGPNTSASYAAIQPLIDFNPSWRISFEQQTFPDYVSFLATIDHSGGPRSAVINTFPQDDQLDDKLIDLILNATVRREQTPGVSFLISITLLGGKMRTISHDSSAVPWSFRNGSMSMSASFVWLDPLNDSAVRRAGNRLVNRFRAVGRGVFLNEAWYNHKEWKDEYWNGKYDRLLAIKKAVDPDNFFYCYHCVGSDLGTGYMDASLLSTSHAARAIPSLMAFVVVVFAWFVRG